MTRMEGLFCRTLSGEKGMKEIRLRENYNCR